MRCIDCHWFETKTKVRREMLSCKDLGEKAHTQSCDHFLKRQGEGQETAEWSESLIGALSDVKFREVFHEIIAESFVLEQDAKLSVATVQAQLQTQGAQVSIDEMDFERHTSRIIDLYILYRLILAMGLGRYTDEIMRAEIERKFRAFTPSAGGVKIQKLVSGR